MAKNKYRIKKYPGVYGYDSQNQRFNGKPDTCYYIVFTVDGKNTTEYMPYLIQGRAEKCGLHPHDQEHNQDTGLNLGGINVRLIPENRG